MKDTGMIAAIMRALCDATGNGVSSERGKWRKA